MFSFIDKIFTDSEEEILVKFFKYIKNNNIKDFIKISKKVTCKNAYIIASYYILNYSNNTDFIQYISAKSIDPVTGKILASDINSATYWLSDNKDILVEVYDELYEFLLFMSPTLRPTPSPPLYISPL